ncbi:MAG TPA: dihydrodipicolinate synthase family protein [Burkholderiales bacterium]|nr:dihydrodipicolinate synthase family protein [Burkholderiales bacterium]
MEATYAGIVGAPVTPFEPDGSVDYDTFAKQVDFLIGCGVRALAHPMHIGESLNLTDGERRDLARALVEAAAGRVPTFVHVSHAGTGLAADLARHATRAGATGIVLMPPYHWRPELAAVLDHFAAVAAAGGGSLIAYNNPAATGVALSASLLGEMLDRVPGVVAIKDASFDMEVFTDFCALVAEKGRDVAVYTGVEHLLTSVPVGGAGCFSALSEIAPRLVQELYRACARAEVGKARELQYRARRLLKLAMHKYPATIKYAMALMGRPVGEARRPIAPLTQEEKARVRSELEALGVLQGEPHGWSTGDRPSAEDAALTGARAL